MSSLSWQIKILKKCAESLWHFWGFDKLEKLKWLEVYQRKKVGLEEIEKYKVGIKLLEKLNVDTYNQKVVKNTWFTESILFSKIIDFISK